MLGYVSSVSVSVALLNVTCLLDAKEQIASSLSVCLTALCWCLSALLQVLIAAEENWPSLKPVHRANILPVYEDEEEKCYCRGQGGLFQVRKLVLVLVLLCNLQYRAMGRV